MWLVKWSSNTNISESKRDLFLGVYAALGVGQGLFMLLESYLLAYGSIAASQLFHDTLLKNILRCPMSFFETVPMGRIVNRFSKDINIIDEKLPKNTGAFINTFMSMAASIYIISYSTPIFLTVLFPIAFIYLLTQVTFLFTTCFESYIHVIITSF